MTFQEKQLGQARETSINPVSVYSPGAGITALIRTIVIANTTDSPVLYRLFIDDDGTTYDESTALDWDVQIPANGKAQIDGYFPMNNSSGNLAYRSSVANTLTITVFGAEVS